jgi:DNA replication protein DnaC
MAYKSHDFTSLFLYPVLEALEDYQNQIRSGSSQNIRSSPRLLVETLTKKLYLGKKGKILLNTVVEYIYRPVQLEWISWYDFTSFLEKCYIEDAQFSLQDGYPQSKQIVGLRLRPQRKVPNVYAPLTRIPEPDSTESEVYKYQNVTCLLFQPFRNLDDFDYENLLINGGARFDKFINNIELLQRSKQSAIRQAVERQQDALNSEDLNHEYDEDDIQLMNEYPEDMNWDDAQNGGLDSLFKTFSPEDIDLSFFTSTSSQKNSPVFDAFTKSNHHSGSTQTYDKNKWAHVKSRSTWKKFHNNIQEDEIDNTENWNDIEPETITLEEFNPKTNPDKFKKLLKKLKKKYTLNKKQFNALKKIAKHTLDNTSPQLQMLLTGKGGTGKSRIISAVTELFTIMKCKHKLQKMAFTGTASFLIGGRTVHSSIGKNQFSKGYSHKQKDQLANMWRKVELILLDECSFIPASLLEEMDKLLRELRNSNLPFGGIHIVYCGDMKQHLSIKCEQKLTLNG